MRRVLAPEAELPSLLQAVSGPKLNRLKELLSLGPDDLSLIFPQHIFAASEESPESQRRVQGLG